MSISQNAERVNKDTNPSTEGHRELTEFERIMMAVLGSLGLAIQDIDRDGVVSEGSKTLVADSLNDLADWAQKITGTSDQEALS